MDEQGRLIIPGSNFVGKTYEELGTEVSVNKPRVLLADESLNRKERRKQAALARKERLNNV